MLFTFERIKTSIHFKNFSDETLKVIDDKQNSIWGFVTIDTSQLISFQCLQLNHLIELKTKKVSWSYDYYQEYYSDMYVNCV